jgi:hypothetical protein
VRLRPSGQSAAGRLVRKPAALTTTSAGKSPWELVTTRPGSTPVIATPPWNRTPSASRVSAARCEISGWNRASGQHAAASILGEETPYVREPYWFSDIGPLRIQQVGPSQLAVAWSPNPDDPDELIGVDEAGRPVSVILIDNAAKLRSARELVAG